MLRSWAKSCRLPYNRRVIAEKDIPAWIWKLALAAAAALWGGSFVVIKGALDVAPPCWLMFVRFFLSTFIVGGIFWRTFRAHVSRRAVVEGMVLGLISGTAYVVQNVGLTSITPGRNAFLTATYCVMVPFINWAISRRRPGAANIVAALLTVLGVGLLSLGDDLSFSLSWGDWLTLASAALFALHIIFVSRFSEKDDVMTLTVVQLAGSAVAALVSALVAEPGADLSVFLSPDMGVALAYLVLLSSCACGVLQNLGQAHVPPAPAALILSLESVFAVVASVVFYGEVVTPRLALGFATIFVAVVVSEVGAPALAWLRGRSTGGDAPSEERA